MPAPDCVAGDPDVALTPAMPGWQELLVRCAGQLGVAVSASQAAQMAWYATELLAWNRRINLTAITDPEEVALKHFVDALVPAPMLPVGARVLDMGCGAGFPGLPLKIARPDLHLTLVDAVRKKISFVSHLIRGLNLAQAVACHARLEDLIRQRPRPVFDVVVCRALGPFPAWLEAAGQLLSEAGFILAWKGPGGDRELAALRGADDTPGHVRLGRLRLAVSVTGYHLPVSGDSRCLVRLAPLP